MRSEINRMSGFHRVQRKRLNFFEFARPRLTDTRFRRCFRISRACFNTLCRNIDDIHGEETFKSEEFLKGLETNQEVVNYCRKCTMRTRR